MGAASLLRRSPGCGVDGCSTRAHAFGQRRSLLVRCGRSRTRTRRCSTPFCRNRASWWLVSLDKPTRPPQTSRSRAAAEELASRSHHLLLLTAAPHRGKEHFSRGLCHLLDAELSPWDPDEDRYDASLRPSRLSFL